MPGVPVRIRLETLKYSEKENSLISEDITKKGVEVDSSVVSRSMGVVIVEAYDLSMSKPDSSTRLRIIWGSDVPLT